jgi:BlaI family transcriptional regulator, penicillinase repressor
MPSLPSDAELAILTVLWRCGPNTVREVHETLAKDTGYTSTLKQMQVMHEKGLLRRTERYRSHVYEAAASREEIQTRIAGDVLHRAFEGSAKDLVLGALTAQRASAKDLNEIRRIIDEFESRRKSR